MSNEAKKKVILAFSGGLDTTFCIPYLIEKGYEVITMTADSGGFSEDELTKINHKSKTLGAIKHYEIDVKDELYDQIISWTIKTEGLYEGSYPNMCADRYIIAMKCIDIAKKENANFIAHGSTAMGNDQVRFNLILQTLAPDIKIIEPIKEMGGNRQEEIDYLKTKGIKVPTKHSKYSINENIMGITYSGSEIDDNKEPSSKMFKLVTGVRSSQTKVYKIKFTQGLPYEIDDEKLNGVEIIQKLNKELGEFGVGKEYYTGNCMIGIKGHIVVEAPALFFLIKAHLALKQYVLTKLQMQFSNHVSQQITELIYTGKILDPAFENLKAYIESEQTNMTGTVMMKIENGNLLPVSVDSKYSLINKNVATYAQGCTWSKEDANGFIKLYGLQSKQANLISKNKYDGKL